MPGLEPPTKHKWCGEAVGDEDPSLLENLKISEETSLSHVPHLEEGSASHSKPCILFQTKDAPAAQEPHDASTGNVNLIRNTCNQDKDDGSKAPQPETRQCHWTSSSSSVHNKVDIGEELRDGSQGSTLISVKEVTALEECHHKDGEVVDAKQQQQQQGCYTNNHTWGHAATATIATAIADENHGPQNHGESEQLHQQQQQDDLNADPNDQVRNVEKEEMNDMDDDIYREEGAEYMDEDEEEALQQFLLEQNDQDQHLVLSHDLSSLTEDALERIHSSLHLETLHLDQVHLPSHGPLAAVHEEEEEDEEDLVGDDGVPLLMNDESSHTSSALVLERLEEALAVNTSLQHAAIVACHAKVVEAALWGLSCVPSGLETLSLEFWNPTSERANDAKYLVWDGLVQLLTRTSTLRSLYLSHVCDAPDESQGIGMDWTALAEGIRQNSTLERITLESLSWTPESTQLLAHALHEHPLLTNCEFVYPDPQRPTLVTIQRRDEPQPQQPQQQVAGTILEDSTNAIHASTPLSDSPKRVKLVKAVSEEAGAC